MKSIVVAISIAFAGPMLAQSPASTDCRALSTAIDYAEKDMSMLYVEGVGDDSAPREAVRQQQVGNDLQVIALNMALAARLGCPSRREPVTTRNYMSAAIKCQTALNAGTTQAPKDPPECFRENWTRDSPSK
jgi:hypothetical protein